MGQGFYSSPSNLGRRCLPIGLPLGRSEPHGRREGPIDSRVRPEHEDYTHYRISSLGNGRFAEETVSGNVWMWTSDSEVDGELMRGRVTTTEQPPTSYASKIEFSFAGGPWMLLEEMTATKVR